MERQGEELSRDYDRTADADLSGDHGLYPEEEQKRRGIRHAGVNPPAVEGGPGI